LWNKTQFGCEHLEDAPYGFLRRTRIGCLNKSDAAIGSRKRSSTNHLSADENAACSAALTVAATHIAKRAPAVYACVGRATAPGADSSRRKEGGLSSRALMVGGEKPVRVGMRRLSTFATSRFVRMAARRRSLWNGGRSQDSVFVRVDRPRVNDQHPPSSRSRFSRE